MENKTYTQEEYNSNSGMLTSVWGPSLWHFLHTMSFNYPVNPTKRDKERYKKFLMSLQYILPCKYCRINLSKYYKKKPLTDKALKNRCTFSKYIYNLHEDINKMLSKKKNYNYKDIKFIYEHFRSRCNTRKAKGCTKSLYGRKSKCIIKIVPYTKKTNTLQINKSCLYNI